MINFNKNHDPRKEDELTKKLQKLLDAIEGMNEEEVQLVNELESLNEKQSEIENGLASIIDKIYDTLFVENYNEITLSVFKNKNNSLQSIIHHKE